MQVGRALSVMAFQRSILQRHAALSIAEFQKRLAESTRTGQTAAISAMQHPPSVDHRAATFSRLA